MHEYLVNCALEPFDFQFDHLEGVFPCAGVEYGLDNFYYLESIGIEEEGSSYELEQVQNFSDSISFQDGHYYVRLPWNKDIV